MKKIIPFLFLLFCFSIANSQCSSIYGLINNPSWSLISVDKYTGAYTSKDTISSLKYVVFETSTIEPDSNRYVFLGQDTSRARNQRIYTIDFSTGKVLYQPISDSNLSEVHYDVKRKKIYALMTNRYTYQLSLVTINPYNGNINVLDSIPGMRIVISETATIGIDSGRYYVMGFDKSYIAWLYALDEATGHLKYKSQGSNVSACQYDTVSKNIYCINDTGSYPSYTFFFDKLNPTTGLVTTIKRIPSMNNVVGGTSAFAQDSLEYFIDADTVGNGQLLYTIKAPSGNVLSSPLLGNGSLSYSGTEYDPCNLNYCNNNFNEPICIVTIDTANKCEIIWGRTNSPPAGGYGHYNIYRDTIPGYGLVHNQALDSLSEYIDLASNPSAGPVSYKLSTFDSCGESSLSTAHTSIYLTTTAALNVYILNWTAYVGFTPTKYLIFRGPALNALVQIDSVANNIFTYHDTLPPPGSFYAIEAVSPSGPCVPTHRPNRLSGSFSNGFNTAILGIQNIGNIISKVNIYPNPSNGMVSLSYELTAGGNIQITIIDELGQIVYNNTELKAAGNSIEQLNLENLASGIYSFRMQTSNGIIVRKLVMMSNR